MYRTRVTPKSIKAVSVRCNLMSLKSLSPSTKSPKKTIPSGQDVALDPRQGTELSVLSSICLFALFHVLTMVP